MGLIVQKFGGSSVRDRERLLRAMRIVRRTWEQGDDVVVVLSAQGDTTDALLARARELTEEPPPRELDALLATGETASVALGAIALASLGVPAVSLSGWQVPVGTDGTHGGANVRSVGAERIRQEIQQKVEEAGLEIIEARITYLAYAPEIAAVMLQRQQASAIIDARKMIVEGAVGMVEMALERLAENNTVELDEERKAAMVSNLLVVLCGNRDAQPVVNSGSLY